MWETHPPLHPGADQSSLIREADLDLLLPVVHLPHHVDLPENLLELWGSFHPPCHAGLGGGGPASDLQGAKSVGKGPQKKATRRTGWAEWEEAGGWQIGGNARQDIDHC